MGKLSFELHQELAQQLDGATHFGYRKVRSYSVDVKSPRERKASGALALESERSAPNRQLPYEDHWIQLPPGAKGEVEDTLKWLDHKSVAAIESLSDEGTTAQVHPLLFVQALWDQCVKAGVQLVRGRASGASQDANDGRWTVDMSEEGQGTTQMRAEKVLLSAGPWTGAVAKQLFDVEVPITEMPGHSIIYKPTSPLPAEALFARILDKGVTNGPELFTRPDGTLYIAGDNSECLKRYARRGAGYSQLIINATALCIIPCFYSQPAGGPLPPGTAQVEKQEGSLKRLHKSLEILSPVIAEGEVVATQLCYRPVTSSGYPYISAIPGLDKVWCCAGHGPWGISLGPGSGKVAAELLMGRKTSADVKKLSLPSK